MYTRWGPYLCGMFVAYLHFKNPLHDYCEGKTFQEWLAFSVCIIIAFTFGCLPRDDQFDGIKLNPVLQTLD